MSDRSGAPSTGSIVGVAMFAVGGFWALDVFGLGVLSLIFDRDVINDPRAGVALGLIMIVAATLALAGGLIRVALRGDPGIRFVTVLLIVAGVYVAYIVAAVVGWIFLAAGPAAEGFFFALRMAGDWPSGVIVVSAFVAVLSYFGTLRYRSRTSTAI